MPFENHGTRAFTRASIDNNAPAASGVYGLCNAQRWVYVGESDNVRLELLAHLRGMNTLLMAQHPTGFTYELCGPEGRMARQNRLVVELEPACNPRFGATA